MNISYWGGKYKMTKKGHRQGLLGHTQNNPIQDNPEGPMSSLETIVINNKNHAHYNDVLGEAHSFIANRYSANKVISLEWVKKELSDFANEAYKWFVAKHNGKVVATVVVDVGNIPKSASTKNLVSDDQNQYTALYYATAAEKKYEPILKNLAQLAIEYAKKYSSSKGKVNIGAVTEDIRHVNVLRELGGKYLAKLPVPTLNIPKGAPDEEYLNINFKTDRIKGKKQYEKLIVIPFDYVAWTKSLTKKVGANYLDEGYNNKKPTEPGYKPLTAGESFKEFSKLIDEKYAEGRIIPLKPITFKK